MNTYLIFEVMFGSLISALTGLIYIELRRTRKRLQSS